MVGDELGAHGIEARRDHAAGRAGTSGYLAVDEVAGGGGVAVVDHDGRLAVGVRRHTHGGYGRGGRVGDLVKVVPGIRYSVRHLAGRPDDPAVVDPFVAARHR